MSLDSSENNIVDERPVPSPKRICVEREEITSALLPASSASSSSAVAPSPAVASDSIPPENRRILDLLDFTLLDHNATPAQLEEFCRLANHSLPAAVCVFAEHVKFVKPLIHPKISIAAVAGGFPIGSNDIGEIQSSIRLAIESGADEIDCVLEPRFNPGDENGSNNSNSNNKNNGEDFPGSVEESKLQAMRESCSNDVVLKVILETSLLNEDSIRSVSQMTLRCGADFLKSSTGKRGGCTRDVASFLAEEAHTFYQSTGSRRGVKLSGGIRSIVEANELLSIVIERYPAVIARDSFSSSSSASASSSVKSVADLCREDSKYLRIGASSILEELMPSLYPKKTKAPVSSQISTDQY